MKNIYRLKKKKSIQQAILQNLDIIKKFIICKMIHIYKI